MINIFFSAILGDKGTSVSVGHLRTAVLVGNFAFSIGAHVGFLVV